ncbi:MAG: bacillithiol biosynthesis cysteine-adding enzyme BshC [Polyangiales bacterium]
MTESVFAALLAGRAEALRLLPGRFADPQAWRGAAEVASERRVAPPLIEELARQSAGLPRCDARERNLELLGRAGTSVVVTGQQVGLFGGPLYTLHKAATAIARARMVTELSGRPCVPLFWLQTEDHDYAEIAQIAVAAPSGRVTLALPQDPQPSRIAVAHRTLPDDVAALLDRLADLLAPLPHAAEVLTLLRTHYAPGRPLALAFTGLLAELWRGHGLLILDPRVPAVARLAAPLMKRALGEHAAIAADLSDRAAAIAQAGCSEQVHTRADAALVFFHPEGSAGPRYRLVRRGDAWETPAGPVSQGVLDETLTRDPLRFSSSALLRPLVQDTLLPTCAYVGGPAEVAYFAQLPPLYARFGVPMPLIAPRARLRVIDATTRSLLGRLGLCAADFDLPRTTLLTRTASDSNASPNVQELRAHLLGALERELEALTALGLHQLADPIRRARETCASALHKLADKVERAALERDQVNCERVDRVIAALRPDGVPQERAYGFAALAARSGTDALLRAILEGAVPLDPAVRDVCP